MYHSMSITTEFKKVLIDILVRSSQVIFALLIIGPMAIAERFNLALIIGGFLVFIFLIIFPLIIATTIEEVN